MVRSLSALALCAGMAAAAPASAQDLQYTPINPSFGGSPFNSSHLLDLANIQRQDFRPRPTVTPTDEFFNRLERSVLAEASRRITQRLFGESQEDAGAFEIGNTAVSYEALDDGSVRVVLTDTLADVTTEIVIPTPVF